MEGVVDTTWRCNGPFVPVTIMKVLVYQDLMKYMIV